MDKEEKISAAQKMLGDFAPKLLGYTDNILFGDLWEGKELSRRERSLITVAALVAGEHSGQLKFHLNVAKEHRLTEEELKEVITHLAFYTGWPKAMTAIMLAKEAFENEKQLNQNGWWFFLLLAKQRSWYSFDYTPKNSLDFIVCGAYLGSSLESPSD